MHIQLTLAFPTWSGFGVGLAGDVVVDGAGNAGKEVCLG